MLAFQNGSFCPFRLHWQLITDQILDRLIPTGIDGHYKPGFPGVCLSLYTVAEVIPLVWWSLTSLDQEAHGG